MQEKRTCQLLLLLFLNLDLNFIGKCWLGVHALGKWWGILKSREASIHLLNLQIILVKYKTNKQKLMRIYNGKSNDCYSNSFSGLKLC